MNIEQRREQYARVKKLIGVCANAIIESGERGAHIEYEDQDYMSYQGYALRLRVNTIFVDWQFLKGMGKCMDALEREI